jgi:hypothetical protein
VANPNGSYPSLQSFFSSQTNIVCLGASHIDRHAFRREKVVFECGMRNCYLVKNGALKTHFAGVIISEEPTMNYNSHQTDWCGARYWPFIVGREKKPSCNVPPWTMRWRNRGEKAYLYSCRVEVYCTCGFPGMTRVDDLDTCKLSKLWSLCVVLKGSPNCWTVP